MRAKLQVKQRSAMACQMGSKRQRRDGRSQISRPRDLASAASRNGLSCPSAAKKRPSTQTICCLQHSSEFAQNAMVMGHFFSKTVLLPFRLLSIGKRNANSLHRNHQNGAWCEPRLFYRPFISDASGAHEPFDVSHGILASEMFEGSS